MFSCSICGKIFEKSISMHNHKRSHDERYMKRYRKVMSDKWSDPIYRRHMVYIHSGANNPNFGKQNRGWHHSEEVKDKIRIHKIGDQNPAKRLDVRKKISDSLKAMKRTSWNKGKKWNRSLIHDGLLEDVAKGFRERNYTVITTNKYVPDAIIINFDNQTVDALEVNPQSVISKEERAREKGYNSLIVRDFKHDRHMERKISSHKVD